MNRYVEKIQLCEEVLSRGRTGHGDFFQGSATVNFVQRRKLKLRAEIVLKSGLEAARLKMCMAVNPFHVRTCLLLLQLALLLELKTGIVAVRHSRTAPHMPRLMPRFRSLLGVDIVTWTYAPYKDTFYPQTK